MEHLRLRYPIYMKGSKGQSLGWMPGLGREGGTFYPTFQGEIFSPEPEEPNKSSPVLCVVFIPPWRHSVSQQSDAASASTKHSHHQGWSLWVFSFLNVGFAFFIFGAQKIKKHV